MVSSRLFKGCLSTSIGSNVVLKTVESRFAFRLFKGCLSTSIGSNVVLKPVESSFAAILIIELFRSLCERHAFMRLYQSGVTEHTHTHTHTHTHAYKYTCKQSFRV
jgi:hypothetical protein